MCGRSRWLDLGDIPNNTNNTGTQKEKTRSPSEMEREEEIKKGFFEGATESGRKKCRKDLQARQKTAIQCLSDGIR